MVEIIGKRNRKVPVLLTPNVKAAIIVLNRTREDGNANQENPYVFAVNDGSSTKFLRGNDAIRQACKNVNLENPEVINSNNLRKYTATVSQLIDMDENELGWLATHLGHDVHIHKEFYRMQESTLEIAVVGNLLMAIDEGRAHQFKGKNLRDITLQGIIKMMMIRGVIYQNLVLTVYVCTNLRWEKGLSPFHHVSI